MSYIYVITNDVNGKQYVGKTNWTIEKRFKEHIHDSKSKRCEKRPLYNAMNKYGIEYFSIKQLEECDEFIASEREQYWIQKLNTYGSTGYNATLGGDSKHYYNYKEIADKYLELQNQKETAKYFNCDLKTVRVACKQYNIKILSSGELSKRKNHKSVFMLSKNGEILKEFFSIQDAYTYINKPYSSHIQEVCNGKRKQAYGYKWKWK